MVFSLSIIVKFTYLFLLKNEKTRLNSSVSLVIMGMMKVALLPLSVS